MYGSKLSVVTTNVSDVTLSENFAVGDEVIFEHEGRLSVGTVLDVQACWIATLWPNEETDLSFKNLTLTIDPTHSTLVVRFNRDQTKTVMFKDVIKFSDFKKAMEG